MATSQISTSNALAAKKWSDKAYIDSFKKSAYGFALKKGILSPEYTFQGKGDEVTIQTQGILTGAGQGEGNTLEGNEESINYGSFKARFGLTRHAVRYESGGSMTSKRNAAAGEDGVPNAQVGQALMGWMNSRVDTSFFNQLAGLDATSIPLTDGGGTTYTGTSKELVQGLNTVAAPSTSRIIRAGGVANDQSLAATLDFNLIDAALELLSTTTPTALPLNESDFQFVLFISPQQFTDLKRSTSTATIRWRDLQQSKMEGGQKGQIETASGFNNPPELVGIYGGVGIYVSNRVAYGQRSDTSAVITTVRRAILCGRKAAVYLSPKNGVNYIGAGVSASSELQSGLLDGSIELPIQAVKQSFDYNLSEGIGINAFYGIKKFQVQSAGNTEDLSSIVISTVAAAHTS
jgi:hypothetical protein